MTRRPSVAAGLLFLAAAAARADAPPPGPAAAPAPAAAMPLDRAVAAGLVTVKGTRPASYRSVELHVASASGEPVTVDLAGRYLKPRSGHGPRLGLSFPQGGGVVTTEPWEKPPSAPTGGVVPLTLLPGETKALRMNSCCMDAGKSCPADGEEFDLASGPPPKHVETALRWWVDHPTAPQGFVNAAIWQASPKLLERPWAPDPAAPSEDRFAPPKGNAVAAYGGVAYLLTDGDLIRLDADGVRSFVGSLVYEAIPLADGLVGIGLGESGREVWRFAQTGEPPWTKRFDLDRQGEGWPEVVPAAGGAHLLLGRSALSVRNAAGVVTVLVPRADRATVDVAATDAARSKFVVVVHEQGKPKVEGQSGGAGIPGASDKVLLYDVTVGSGTAPGAAKLRKTFWNVGDMAAGPGGIFALSHVGVPERLDGERLVRLAAGQNFERILAVGVERFLVADEAGAVFSVDGRSGRVTPLPGTPTHRDTSYGGARTEMAIDPVTDDLVWWDRAGFHRWRRDAKEPELLR